MVDEVHTAGVILAKEADARRGELERERQVPKDLFQRAGDAGLFRQLVCAELGGLGRSAAQWFRTGVEMARWEPSFSWVITQGAGDQATYPAAGDPDVCRTISGRSPCLLGIVRSYGWHAGARG